MKRFFIITGIIIMVNRYNLLDKPYRTKADDLIEEEASFVLVISSLNCNYCTKYKNEAIKEYKEDPILPLVILELETDFEGNRNNVKSFYKNHNLQMDEKWGVPVTYVIKDGKFIDNKGKFGALSIDVLRDYASKGK